MSVLIQAGHLGFWRKMAVTGFIPPRLQHMPVRQPKWIWSASLMPGFAADRDTCTAVSKLHY